MNYGMVRPSLEPTVVVVGCMSLVVVCGSWGRGVPGYGLKTLFPVPHACAKVISMPGIL